MCLILVVKPVFFMLEVKGKMQAANHYSKMWHGCLRKEGMRKEETVEQNMYKLFLGENVGFDRTEWRRGSDFVVKIVSFANPISCQLNPSVWNILKFTQSARGRREGGTERWTEKSVEVKKKEKEKRKKRKRAE